MNNPVNFTGYTICHTVEDGETIAFELDSEEDIVTTCPGCGKRIASPVRNTHRGKRLKYVVISVLFAFDPLGK